MEDNLESITIMFLQVSVFPLGGMYPSMQWAGGGIPEYNGQGVGPGCVRPGGFTLR